MNATFLSILRTFSFAAVAALGTAIPSCAPARTLLRSVEAVERPDVEILKGGAALVRSLYCDITVVPVDGNLWRKIQRSQTYGTTGSPVWCRRLPPVCAFQVILKNTVNAPIQAGPARLLFNGEAREPLTEDDIPGWLKSGGHVCVNMRAMGAFRRIVRERESVAVDFDRDTMGVKLDFIPPKDAAVQILVFRNLPVQIRSFTLRIAVTALGAMRTIDFEFSRRELRGDDASPSGEEQGDEPFEY